MTGTFDRSGVTHSWEYPAGATDDDLEFMARTAEILPAIRRSVETHGDQTQWMSTRWFES